MPLLLAHLTLASSSAQLHPNHVDLAVTTGDRVGCSAAILHDFAVVGACGASYNGVSGSGAVHSLRLSTRQSSSIVAPPTIGMQFGFGASVTMAEYTDNTTTKAVLLVGQPGEHMPNREDPSLLDGSARRVLLLPR